MIKRFLQENLQALARQYPVLTLTGPRQSGKTFLGRAAFPDWSYASLEDLETRRFATEDPRGFLAQYSGGVILDEVQRTPDLPSYIQGMVDERQEAGQFLLTGSQQFEVTRSVNQSLAGRTAVLRLLPFAWGEIYSEAEAPDLNTVLYTGFYPRIHDQRLNPTEALSFYTATYLERDLQSLIQVRDMGAFERFLKICAGQVGQLVNFSKLGNDVGVDQKTVKSWISIMEASYIIFPLRPHFQNFRKRLVKSPKLYFCDVGLACFLLGIGKPEHLESHPLRGSLFENFVIAEFLKNRFNRVQTDNLYFFRDHVGNEVDLILDYGSDLIPVEIKAGKTLTPDYFKGISFYRGLSEKSGRSAFLVYGGTEAREQSGVRVFSYRRLPDLFSSLPG